MTGRTQVPGRQILDDSVNTADIVDLAVTDNKLSLTGVGAGTYTQVTVSNKGRVTAASSPSTLGGYGITDAAPLSPSYLTINAEVTLPNERRLVGTAGQISLTDGGGNSTATLALVTTGTPGTYRSVTTDDRGRVTAGTNPTTLAGYGITDAQPLDATLSALAGFNATGFLVQTGPDAFAGRTLTAASSRITITNPAGTAGNPALDVSEGNLSLNSIGGTLAVDKGGTGLTAVGTAAQVLATNAAGTALGHRTITGSEGITVTTPSEGVINIAGSGGASSPILQVVFGTAAVTSSNTILPYDNTIPQSNEGVQLWARSFTPLSASSTILITCDGFAAVASTADIFVSGAIFAGATCISARLLLFTTSISGEGGAYSYQHTVNAGSTDARTYSYRAGPNAAVTVHHNRGVSSQTYGGLSSGRYVIMEIAG